MRDILHDEKDALQDILEKWRNDLEVIRSDIAKVIRHARDPREIFAAANILAADKLGGLTTEAAQLGLRFGKVKSRREDIGDPIQT